MEIHIYKPVDPICVKNILLSPSIDDVCIGCRFESEGKNVNVNEGVLQTEFLLKGALTVVDNVIDLLMITRGKHKQLNWIVNCFLFLILKL